MSHPGQIGTSSVQQFDRFCRQFLQLYSKIEYPDGRYLRDANFQQALYERLFSERARRYQIPVAYQLRVLKELVRRIEGSIVDWDKYDISNQLMTLLTTLLASHPPSQLNLYQDKTYVTYTLSSLSSESDRRAPIAPTAETFSPSDYFAPTITLYESTSVLAAGGTTGLRTWEAALQMGNYLSTHPELVRRKNVLELGSGTAYLSILCAKHLEASHVIATDGTPTVVADHSPNFHLNGLATHQISSKLLLWENGLGTSIRNPHYLPDNRVDVVLGADLTYDEPGITALLHVLKELLTMFPEIQVLISATIRNMDTYFMFSEGCTRERWNISMVQMVEWEGGREQEGPFFEIQAPIVIVSISNPLNSAPPTQFMLPLEDTLRY
ncbi:hypothetical protein K3495_g4876 [Podosphaera aphanis]|nr:hypothetical protein K3495_g4876 [Podosphaera aphanis]